MKAIVLLALISFAAASSISSKSSQRIIGGTVTTINKWPMAASLLLSENFSIYWQACGGAIINNRSILSGASCVINTTSAQWRIRIGSSYANSGGTVHTVSAIISQAYNQVTLDNDIALLRSSAAFIFSDTVGTVNIPGVSYQVYDNSEVYAIGWGVTTSPGYLSEQLREVQLWSINQNLCKTRYAGSRNITDNMMCVGVLDFGGRDQCLGDSGSPLFHSGIVVGVYSFGTDCASPYYPSVNTRVSQFSPWIVANA